MDPQTRIRKVIVRTISLCRAIKTLEPDQIDELKEGIDQFESECLTILQDIDSPEDN